jgi:hypothetical protein
MGLSIRISTNIQGDSTVGGKFGIIEGITVICINSLTDCLGYYNSVWLFAGNLERSCCTGVNRRIIVGADGGLDEVLTGGWAQRKLGLDWIDDVRCWIVIGLVGLDKGGERTINILF